jgi:hypothetical protein
MAIRRDPVGDSEIGHEAEHAGDLKSPQQKIERGPFVVGFVSFRHDHGSSSKGGGSFQAVGSECLDQSGPPNSLGLTDACGERKTAADPSAAMLLLLPGLGQRPLHRLPALRPADRVTRCTMGAGVRFLLFSECIM